MKARELWATKLGLILAMAGNAIGLGNFLRFPVQAAQNGGGAFMIPYFISFILLGLPLMWIEWSIGRYGGVRGHGSAVGAFDSIWKSRAAKYVGIAGIFIPLMIIIYYTYIESWCLGYSIFSLMGQMPTMEAVPSGPGALNAALAPFAGFLDNYIGATGGVIMSPTWAVLIFVGVLIVNIFILAKGISGGIEKFALVAMPLLFIFAVILSVRVLTLGSPVIQGVTPLTGLAFLWEPDFSQLANAKVWLAAAGQVFFTLSVGSAAILTYASYVREKDDIALTGLTTAGTNEFAEIILGGTIAIPAAVAFFGVAGAQEVATGGSFSLGFVSTPAVFSQMPGGGFFSTIWFALLFFAGITSSVALSQPVIAFLEDEIGWSRKRSALALGIFMLLCTQVVIWFNGALDEMDFWVGTLGLVVLGLFEALIFMWFFNSKKAWEELHKGALIRVPRPFYYIMKYVTPVLLFIILVAWLVQSAPGVLAKTGVGVWVARGTLVSVFALFIVLVRAAWKRRNGREKPG